MNPRRPVLRHNSELRRDPVLVTDDVDLQSRYAFLEDYFEEALDEQNGIVRSVEKNENHPEGMVVRYNSTADLPFPSPYRVNEDKLLIKSLKRLRAIDYVLEKKSKEEKIDFSQLRLQLKNALNKLNNSVSGIEEEVKNGDDRLKKHKEKLEELEGHFESALIYALGEAKLNTDIISQTEYEKLLKHYEDLSSKINPARTVVTLTYHKDADISDDEVVLLDPEYNYLKRETRTPEKKHIRINTNAAMKQADAYFDTPDQVTVYSVSEETFEARDFPQLSLNIENRHLEFSGSEPTDCDENKIYAYIQNDQIYIKYLIELNGKPEARIILAENIKNIHKKEEIFAIVQRDILSYFIELKTNKAQVLHITDDLNKDRKAFEEASAHCYPDLKPFCEKLISAFDLIEQEDIPNVDVHNLARALQISTYIIQGNYIDLTDPNNPIAELVEISKKLDKQNRYKQVAAALFLFIGATLIVGTIAYCILFPPVALVGIALGILVSKIMATTLAGSLSAYFGLKKINKEWKHARSPLKLVGDELSAFAKESKKAALTKVPFTPDFFIEYCDNPDVKASAVHSAMAAFNDKIIYTPGKITQLIEEANSNNDLDRDSFKKDLASMTALTAEEKNALLATRAGITEYIQGGATNAGSYLLGSYFLFATGAPISASSRIADIKKVKDGFIIDSVLIPDNYKLTAIPGTIITPEIKNPFEYREKYHLKKVGDNDNWELTLLKANSLAINPKLWKIILDKAVIRLNEAHHLTNDDLFVFVPCLKEADFSKSFLEKLKNNSKLITPEQYSLLKNLISANYGERWPVHLKELKTKIESNSPKPESQTRRLIM